MRAHFQNHVFWRCRSEKWLTNESIGTVRSMLLCISLPPLSRQNSLFGSSRYRGPAETPAEDAFLAITQISHRTLKSYSVDFATSMTLERYNLDYRSSRKSEFGANHMSVLAFSIAMRPWIECTLPAAKDTQEMDLLFSYTLTQTRGGFTKMFVSFGASLWLRQKH